MTIPITINVKESAYDKIIYFLSHFKDDVSIVKEPIKQNSLEKIKILERLSRLEKLVSQSNNSVTVTRERAIDTDGMSDDIS